MFVSTNYNNIDSYNFILLSSMYSDFGLMFVSTNYNNIDSYNFILLSSM